MKARLRALAVILFGMNSGRSPGCCFNAVVTVAVASLKHLHCPNRSKSGKVVGKFERPLFHPAEVRWSLHRVGVVFILAVET